MTAGAADREARQRGFALLIVLWTMALLALLGTQIVAAGRSDAQRARNLRAAAVVEAATDGAVQQAIFHLLEQRWVADGAMHIVRLGPVAVAIRIEDEGGKVNPNIASETLLRALLAQVGVVPARAASLAAAIVDWRTDTAQPLPFGAKAPQDAAAGLDYAPPGADFRSVDELAAVLGMTPALLARLQPHMTVFSDADPDASTRDPVVAAALGDPAQVPAVGLGGVQTVTVTAEGNGPEGGASTRRVVVRTNAQADRHTYEMLALEHVSFR